MTEAEVPTVEPPVVVTPEEPTRVSGVVLSDEEPEVTDFDRMMATMKKKKRKKMDLGDEEAADMVHSLLENMRQSYNRDLEFFQQGQPATSKLTLVDTVVSCCGMKPVQRRLLDEGVLSRIRDWLLPLDEDTLVNASVRSKLYHILDRLPVDRDALLECEEESDLDGIGKVLMRMYSSNEETEQNKRLLRHLIEKWLRPICLVDTDYRNLAYYEEHHKDRILKRSSKMLKTDSGPKYLTRHAQIPNKASFDFAIRPKGNVSTDADMRLPVSKEERLLEKIGSRK